MSPNLNPYSTSANINPVATNRHVKASPKLLLAFISAAIAYFVFTAMLLTSTPVDQRLGAMFIWNLPIVIAMLVAGFWSKTIAAYSALFATGVQIVIGVLSRYRAIGGDILGTVVITTPIVLLLLGLAFRALQPPEQSYARSEPKKDGSQGTTAADPALGE